MTSYYCCQDKECLSLSSYDPEKTTDEHGLISNCTKCGNEHVICLFPGCDYALLSKNAMKCRWSPWKYFINRHINVVHTDENNSKRRKIVSDHDIQPKSQGVMDNDIVFDVSEDNVGTEKFHITQAASFVVVVQEEMEETEDIDSTGCDEEPSNHDEGSVQSDDTSECWSLINADDLDGITPLDDGCIDEGALTDDSCDDPHQGVIAELLDDEIIPKTFDCSYQDKDECADKEPESVDGTDERVMIDNIYSSMEKIYDRRSDEEKREGLRGTHHAPLSQEALYFAQKYYTLLKDPKNNWGGYCGLVSRANGRDRNDKYQLADYSETLAVFLYHMLVTNLKNRDLEILLRYEAKKNELLDISQELTKQKVAVRFPRSLSDVRRLVSDGSFSLMKNFPSQRVFVIDGHACVSIRETFCIAAGHYGGFQFTWDGGNQTRNTDGLNGCKQATRLCHQLLESLSANGCSKDKIASTHLGYISLWSDSFLKSFIKQKNNSVWLLTATISPPLEKRSTGKYTFVIAIGKSSNDHTAVINHFLKEIIDLEKGFDCYFVDRNEIRHTALGLLCYVADRPERNAVRHTRTEGTYGKFTDWAAAISTKNFAACANCFHSMVKMVLGNEELSPHNGCSRCLGWTLDESHDPRKYRRTTASYPQVRIPNRQVPKGRHPGATHIGPKMLSSKWMIAVCSYAYDARRLGYWTKENIMEYLRTCNIQDSVIEAIDKIAQEDRKSESISPPEKYIPEVWHITNLFSRNTCFDAPMHGFCHGMIVNTMDANHQIFANWKRLTNYITKANCYIKTIDSFKLDWIKIKSLPKSAWIGENTMAYMRIMSYLYGMYFKNGSLNPEYNGTILNMKRLINCLQSVASMFMSRGSLRGDMMRLRFQVLLSNAQRLQEEYEGSLKSKAVGRSGKGSSIRRRVVDFLNPREVTAVLELVEACPANDGSDSNLTLSQKRKQLDRINKPDLVKELQRRDISVHPTKESKDTLQKLLFEEILQRQLDPDDGNNTAESQRTDEVEERFWNKGAWLSLVTNIDGMVEWYSNILLLWEAKEENAIRDPKSILFNMRNDPLYFEGKLRLLHKLRGLESLYDVYRQDGRNAIDGIYSSRVSTTKMYHTFSTKAKVLEWFHGGNPLSCFCIDNDYHVVHVSVRMGDCLEMKKDDNEDFAYMSFTYNTHDSYDCETGVHYCKFIYQGTATAKKSDLNFTDYALMLPFDRQGQFLEQYTLIYSDWEVLIGDENNVKGQTPLSEELYTDLLNGRVY